MSRSRLVLCGGLGETDVEGSPEGWKTLQLNVAGDSPNVNVTFEDMAVTFGRYLRPRDYDFLEIAAYVYAADCAVARGKGWLPDGSSESWDRDFRFVIPVSDVDFWSRTDVKTLLRRILNFFSSDRYDFEFRAKAAANTSELGHFDFSNDESWAFYEPERVLMFSGGLDSVAGAAEMAVAGHNLVLVSHRSHAVLSRRQRDLFHELNRRYDVQMLHVPVWINKKKGLDREDTQRTRSFLFTALGTLVAQSLGAKGVRLFENGVVSLNLPVAQEVLRARASRTTHPYALDLLGQLTRLVLDRDFCVDNPFLLKTKTEVVQTLDRCQGSELISYSASCAHQGRKSSRSSYHCGTCSQCIDRRVAILASGLEKYDPEYDYMVDVFRGPRRSGPEKNMAVNYAAHVVRLKGMTPDDIAAQFSAELSTAVRAMKRKSEAAEQLVDLHVRHAEAAHKVLVEQIQGHAASLISGELPSSSMLQMIAEQIHNRASWSRLADRISSHLQEALPRACATETPANEQKLQELCDGILAPLEPDLRREFPFMPWSASTTKPDWSNEAVGLWVELKFIRQKRDILVITEAIAADITKYGDNERHVLFVVYDPGHLLLNEVSFREPIERHGHLATVIR